MSKKTFSDVRIQTKRDTSANWTLNDPVLLNGEEIIVDTNSGEIRKKIGDGKKKYSELPFTDEPIKTLISNKVDKVNGKGLSTNDYTTTEKEKLASIEDGANKYTHPSTHAATMITTDSTHRFVTDAEKSTWNAKASTAVATSTANGLMASGDKSKLDGIEDGANKYTHPSHTKYNSALYKVAVDEYGHVSAATTVTKTDITGLGIPGQDTTYQLVTTDSDGLMASSDKVKLDSIEDGANKYVHPASHAATMITTDTTHRFVTDSQINTWNAKAPTTLASSTVNGLMASDDKAKLDGIEANANKYIHPSSHAATMITEDTSHRFVTDAEKSTWNAKASTAVATSSANGLMASADKSKLDGIDEGANKYTHPTYTGVEKSSGLYKLGINSLGHITSVTAATKGDITGLGIPSTNTTYSAGTGLELGSDNTFNHSNSITAGTAKGDDTKTLAYGGTFTVPSVTYDAQGHITSVGKTTMTMPAKPADYSHPTSHPATMITQDSNNRFVTDDQIKAWNAKADNSALTAHTGSTSNPHSVTKSQVGLSNVTNDAQVKRSEMGVAGGVATLDGNGLIPSTQLPSYVDDIIEGWLYNSKFHEDSSHTKVITAESGKIYIDLHSGKTYRWSGTAYAVVSETLALGETSSTAYAGDKGKANAAAIVTINEKLATIEDGANKYVHPSTHAATMITTDTTHRFVTDAQITAWNAKASTAVATSSANGLMSSGDKSKLDGIDEGANKYVHPSTHAATMITTDSNNRFVTDAEKSTWNAKASTAVATSTANGLMASGDKSKLDGIDTGANKYTHPTYTVGGTTSTASPAHGGTFTAIGGVSTNSLGHVTSIDTKTVTLPTYGVANSTTSGLMSADDKAKLDGIAAGANKFTYTHPTYTARTGVPTGNLTPGFGETFNITQPVSDGTGHITAMNSRTITIPSTLASSTANGLMASADKSKLDGIATGANKYVHSTHTAYSSGLYKVTVNSEGHVTAATAVAKADITGLGIPGSNTNTTYDLSAPASAVNGDVKLNLTAGGSGSGTDSVSIKGSGATTVTTDADGVITISSTDNNTTYNNATTTAAGLMSSTDKGKLDGIATGANKYVHPSYTSYGSGLYKVTVDASGHVSAATAVTKADITGLGIPGSDTNTNTTYDLSAPASATNGNVKLNLTAGGSGSGTDSVSIKGAGATTVTTDANGVITISSTDNNTDTNTSHSHSAGVGLASSGSAGTGGGTYTYKAKLRSETALTIDSAAATTTSGRVYPVAVDKTGYLAVNVPWTDNNTTYSNATTTTAGLMSAADKVLVNTIADLTTRLAAVEEKLKSAVFYG